ncbi:MAG: nicotinate-nucleotide--dimethylbenzimidazole phosphoribosyltransferase [Parvibaculaceae bacterium]|nr:nicotinate-nucleotide--dimethylbenzimidazole phosphoribosyltransferase [Parvibaculaceae bacterium]
MTRAATGLPFDDIRNLLEGLPHPDTDAVDQLKEHIASLAVVPGGLGVMAQHAEWVAAWQGDAKPQIAQPLIAVFAATQGIATRHLPQEVLVKETRTQLELMAAGGAPVNQIAHECGAGLKVFDLALDMPTPDICEEDALDEAACAATMAFGMEAIAGGADILCVSDAGVGTEATASALAMKLFGGSAQEWAEDPAVQADIQMAIERHADTPEDLLEVLRRIAGRDIAAMAGAILAARYQHIPVLLDGFASTVAAALLFKISPNTIAHCMATHSAHAAHDKLLEKIGKKPLLGWGIRQAQGTGAALAIGLLKSSLSAVSGTARRDQLS